MMGFGPPQPEGQIVDCEATYYDGDTDNLLVMVKISRSQRGRVRCMNVLLLSMISAR